MKKNCKDIMRENMWVGDDRIVIPWLGFEEEELETNTHEAIIAILEEMGFEYLGGPAFVEDLAFSSARDIWRKGEEVWKGFIDHTPSGVEYILVREDD